ncbi:MAG: hypothetical protein ACI9XK_003675, partial [Granulosicoccus sp.]
PASTTVQFLRTQMDDGLIQSFKSSLELAGYGVRWVGESVGTPVGEHSVNNLLQYRREELNVSGTPEQLRLDIAVGDVELRRSYTGWMINQVQPVTPLYVRGADATLVVLDDAQIFRKANSQAIEAVPLTVPKNISPLSGLVASVSTANSLTVGTIASLNAKNVFDLGGSNYANALGEHDIVVEQVLTFPNDSLRMGNTNKELLDALVTRYNPVTDLFSVLGCSLGPTNLKNGNAALALGRASRVREALLFAGVDQHKILDEGCWAGDSSNSTLPRRGVVVTLNRQFR